MLLLYVEYPTLLAYGTLTSNPYMGQMRIIAFVVTLQFLEDLYYIFTPKDVTYKISLSIWQTNGNKQSEFLVDFISTKWSSSFCNVEAVLDFADIKRFVRGYRR